MKRSKQARLTLMAASSALALSACSSKPQETQTHTYADVEACKSAGVFSDERCTQEFTKAVSAHETSAPRYESESLCEKEFSLNNCYKRTESGYSFWSPFMTGFLVSQIINNTQSNYYASPYYHSARGRYLTWDGSIINTRRGEDGQLRSTVNTESIKAKPKPAKIMTRTSVISRGGFGSRTKSRSTSRSSWGG